MFASTPVPLSNILNILLKGTGVIIYKFIYIVNRLILEYTTNWV